MFPLDIHPILDTPSPKYPNPPKKPSKSPTSIFSVISFVPLTMKKVIYCSPFHLQNSGGYLCTNPTLLLGFAGSSCFPQFLVVSLRRKKKKKKNCYLLLCFLFSGLLHVVLILNKRYKIFHSYTWLPLLKHRMTCLSRFAIKGQKWKQEDILMQKNHHLVIGFKPFPKRICVGRPL